MNEVPQVSVVIPVRNEAAGIRACVEGILAQTVPVHEIVVLDSGSTDGTLEILAEYPQVRVIDIDPANFNHGETRNVGVQAAEGADIVVLTVGDARPVDDRWIEHLLAGFTDEDVVGVCGQQVVPHERDKNPAQWFRPAGPPTMVRHQFGSAKAFDALTPYEKKQATGWDDVTAAYRRSELLAHPFERTSYAEDMIWARAALRRGKALVFNTAARVYHYHLESPDFTFERTLTVAYYRYKYLGLAHSPGGISLRAVLSAAKTLLMRSPGLSLKERMAWWIHTLRARIAIERAHHAFSEAYAQGDAALDALHEQHCGRPPIPPKATA